MSKTYFAGIDVGSLSTEAVIVDSDENLVSYSILITGLNSNVIAEKALAVAIEKAGISRDQITKIIATGYGRASVSFADKQSTEITCHAIGAQKVFPGVHTIIDMGGQDSKVIHIDQDGQLVDFAMNDKCAAGTGRFLEVMAKRLEVELEEFGRIALESKSETLISSTCTVFAESEVVSLLAGNHPRDSIIRGLHISIVNRVLGQVNTVGIHGKISMTGGVAKNQGVVNLIEEKIGQPLCIHSEPQIIGALGAALIASR